MLSRKKIAVASLLLSGFAVTGVGIAQSYAGGAQGHCTRKAPSSLTCTQKNETTYTSKDGTYHVKQKQNCTMVSRQANQSKPSAKQSGTTHTSSTMNCSLSAPAPKDFVAPGIGR
jgi:hypothetical protein